jgi:hypothetical protein
MKNKLGIIGIPRTPESNYVFLPVSGEDSINQKQEPVAAARLALDLEQVTIKRFGL